MKKRMLSLLLALVLVLSLVPTAGAALTPVVSGNANAQSYHEVWHARPVYSYLHTRGSGMERVEYVERTARSSEDAMLIAEQYTMDGQITGRTSLEIELPIFGGFFAGEQYNFVVFGQQNPDDSDEVEVFRVVRYSKAWKRLDSVSLYGEDTHVPFQSGSLRMTEDDTLLYVHTCHTIYEIDGIHHQTNYTFAIRKNDMTVFDTSVHRTGGFVSHSFNQFVALDGERLIKLDQGDGNPRGAYLFRCEIDENTKFITKGRVSRVKLLAARKENEDEAYQDTGMSLGGLVVTDTHYLAVGSSIDQTTSDNSLDKSQRNIFVAAVPKDDLTEDAVQVRWLTSYEEGDNIEAYTPQIVRISASKSLLLWYAEDLLHYVFLKADGTTDGKVYTAKAALSDCAPTVIDGKVYWYVTEYQYLGDIDNRDRTGGDAPTFYCIDPAAPGKVSAVGGGQGICGETTFSFDASTGRMTIGGTGKMRDGYVSPWVRIREEIRSVVIEDGVTHIGNYAFADCPNLKTVTIGSGVTSVSGVAFANSGVTSFSVSASNPAYSAVDGVLFSKDKTKLIAFPGGRSGAYQIPDGVTSLGHMSFFGCTELTSLSIPASVTMMYSETLYDCPALTAFSVDAANAQYTASNGVLLNRDKTKLIRYPQAKSGAYSVPAGVQSMDSGAFRGCTGLTSVTLPLGMTEVSYQAFQDCTSLKRVVLSNDIITISSYAFDGCTALQTVFIPVGVTSVVSIFPDSRQLKSVYYGGTEAQWDEVKKGKEGYRNRVSKATVYYSSVFLTAQPESVTADAGSTATFAVKATGNGLKYQWQYKTPDGSWTDCTSATTGYNKATLKVEAAEKRNGYRYRCRVTDANGGYVTSSTAKLTVNALKITTQPKAASVKTTAYAAFTVKAFGSNLKYQWQYKTPSGSWTNCTSKTEGYNKATLKVQGVTGSTNRNGYQYRCVVKNSSGSVTSKAVTLNVLAISTQPKAATVSGSSYASFTVKATGAGLNYQWQYLKPNGSWTNCTSKTEGYHKSTLKVQGVTGDTNRNGYQYRCKVTDSAGNTVTTTAAKLTVEKLAITTQPKAASVKTTGYATFTVKASGGPLKYRWQYKKPGGSWTACTSATKGYNTATLKVQGVTGSTNRDGYQYRCRVSDDNNVVRTSVVTLSVLAITTQPKAASVSKTGTATFKVAATGDSLKYQWQYLKPGGSWANCTSATTGYHSATLKVQGATGSTNRNGYQYRCVITDGAGNKITTSAVKLTVK